MKFEAVAKTLCSSVSTSIWVNSMKVCDVCRGIQLLEVVSTCSISNISPSVSSFSAYVTTWFLGRYSFSMVLRFTITYGVTMSSLLLERSVERLYMYMLGLLVKQSSSGFICTLSVLVVLISTSTTAQLLGGSFVSCLSETYILDLGRSSFISAIGLRSIRRTLVRCLFQWTSAQLSLVKSFPRITSVGFGIPGKFA